MSRLLLDAGNTRLKWVWESRLPAEAGVLEYADADEIAVLAEQADSVWVACVSGDERESRLRGVLESVGKPVHWLKTEESACGVRNAYVPFERLGVDRWLAAVAARQRIDGAVLVVSAGTALTVDAVSSEGVFLGGVIVPGLSLMRSSLERATAGIVATHGDVVAFPRNTGDAVASGALQAAAGAVERQYRVLSEKSGMEPVCLVSGGDALLLLSHLEIPATYVPALVLEGVACVAREWSRS